MAFFDLYVSALARVTDLQRTSSFSINLISPFSVGCYDDERNRDFSFPVHTQLFSRCTEYDKPDSILMRFDYSKY